MLCNLHVRNFALIDEAEIDFDTGLNILTGETGAGKSILIDAVNAALGGRVHPDVIRRGADSAFVELVFSVEEAGRKRLEQLGVATEYDCIIISRRILPGRSIHKINDETVTSARVRQVTEFLLDIHGQQEHQSLLHSSRHREILDQYADSSGELRRRTAAAYDAFREAEKRCRELSADEETRKREMDFLRYEIGEIESAALKPDEEAELMSSYRRMKNSRKLEELVSEALSVLSGGENDCSDLVSRSVRALKEAAGLDASLQQLCEQLETAEDLLDGSCRDLEDYRNDLAVDPGEWQRTEERLDLIHQLQSKYGRDYEAIARSLAARKAKWEQWSHLEELRQQAGETLSAAQKALQSACEELHGQRSRALKPLCTAITAGLKELNFPHVDFAIRLEPLPETGRDGSDRVEFCISLNEGETPMPLARVASGGELSRIMLAIRTVLSEKDDIPTLIFDEIDTGISGRTAQMVSRKLSTIARRHQVICITHLPQIAAMADRHFLIEKRQQQGRTLTSIQLLKPAEIVEELSRLLGGEEITDTVRENAREMKQLAEKSKEV